MAEAHADPVRPARGRSSWRTRGKFYYILEVPWTPWRVPDHPRHQSWHRPPARVSCDQLSRGIPSRRTHFASAGSRMHRAANLVHGSASGGLRDSPVRV